MNTEIPSQVIVATATVIAALITGVIATVNLTLGKEQKVSEMRNAWIDAMREDLAKYFSGMRFVSNSYDEYLEGKDDKNSYAFKRDHNQIMSILSDATETFYRIQLRLNSKEDEHVELERLLSAVLIAYNDWPDDAVGVSKETIKKIEIAKKYARGILKDEWGRVKSGEPTFQKVRQLIAPVIIFFTTVFVVVILFAKYEC